MSESKWHFLLRDRRIHPIVVLLLMGIEQQDKYKQMAKKAKEEAVTAAKESQK